MNKQQRKEYYSTRIFTLLDRIECRLNVMAHDIPELSDKLKRWHDGEVTDIYFTETLNKFIDKLNQQTN